MIFPGVVLPPAFPVPQPPAAPLYFSALTSPNRSLCWLIEIDAEVASIATAVTPPLGALAFLTPPGAWRVSSATTLSTTTLRYASRPFVTGSGDAPANTPIEGRVSPFRVARLVEYGQDGTFAPIGAAQVSEIELGNGDGALDTLADQYLIEGRTLRLRVGSMVTDSLGRDQPPALAAFSTVFVGVIDALSWRRDAVLLKVRDARVRLNRQVQGATYTGGGGIDGTPEMKGVTRPMAFGTCFGVRPQLVDPGVNIYQCHDGEMRSVDAVYDSGVPLTPTRDYDSYDELADLRAETADAEEGGAFDLPLGSFATCLKAGVFRLAGTAAGVVTADIRGAGGADTLEEPFDDGTLFTDGTGWDSGSQNEFAGTCGRIILWLLGRVAKLTSADLNEAQFLQTDAAINRTAGVFVAAGQTASVRDLVGQLLASMGCILIRSSDGRYQLRQISGPGETAVLTIGPDQIVPGTLERLELPYRQPWARWRVSYARNWSPLTETDFADAVDPGMKPRFMRLAETAEAVDDGLAIKYPARDVGLLDSLLADADDAEAEADRLLGVYSAGRAMFRAECTGLQFRLEDIDTIKLVNPRYGLANGRLLTVLATEEDGKRGTTTLTLWG